MSDRMIQTPRSKALLTILPKVPAITGYFWVAKVLTTAMGEAASDKAMSVNPRDAIMLGAVGCGAALVLQFAAAGYVAWRYWLLVAMISVFGTMAADTVHAMGCRSTRRP